jgi:hypothetical protein
MLSKEVKLSVLEGPYTVHRFSANQGIPEEVHRSEFYSVSRSEEELSIVCASSLLLNAEKSEAGWSCIKVLGPLDFSLAGILADILAVLARAEISIFAISTFTTDYILIKSENLPVARKALVASGYTFQS